MPTHENVILACYLTGKYDVNRNCILAEDDYSIIKPWAESIIKHRLKGIVFHNNFSNETVSSYYNEHIEFINVEFNHSYSANVFRYFIYKDFLETTSRLIDGLFLTDISDVLVLNNPFESSFYLNNPFKLFCGDEPITLENEWMINHSTHLRQNIADYTSYEKKFKDATLLNCGIIGGKISLMKEFLTSLCKIHFMHNQDNKTAYTGDMGAFNYLMRTTYNHKLVHGVPCNTEFKAYQTYRTDCWFSHK